MKKKILYPVAVILASSALLTACASGGGTSSTEATSNDTASATSAESTTASTAETTASSVSYAWLGLEDMPKCNYLDLVAADHYYAVYDNYVLSIVSESKEAVDGINSYKDTGSNRTWSVDGKVLTVSDNLKTYMESDMSSAAETAKKIHKEAIEKGTNSTGREFKEKGKGTIPVYSDKGDTAEYEYYEYSYPASESEGTKIVERFYMKDGDVYAIYKATTLGESTVETTQLVKSISADIPAGTFDLPNLDGYSKM